MQPNESQQVIAQKRHKIMLILWGMLFACVGLYFLLTKLAANRAALPDNRILVIAFSVISVLLVLASFLFKHKLVARAIEQQSAAGVQSAYIIAFALCESAALFGILLGFATNERYYYLLFIIAAVGFLINMPRRSHMANASSSKRI